MNTAINMMKEILVDPNFVQVSLNLASCLIEGMSSFISSNSDLFPIIQECCKIDDTFVISELEYFFIALAENCPRIVSEKIADFFVWLLPLSVHSPICNAIYSLFSVTHSDIPIELVSSMLQNVASAESFGAFINAISSVLLSSSVKNNQYMGLLQPFFPHLSISDFLSEFFFFVSALIHVCPEFSSSLYQDTLSIITQLGEVEIRFHFKSILQFSLYFN